MTISDSIEREIIINADINAVWDAITNPKKLSQWFGDQAEIEKLAEGEPITFGWDDDICKGIIQTVNKPNVFAFRWQSSRLGKTTKFQDEYATLVTYTLTSIPTGTHLHMLETGFASLPDEIIDRNVVSSPELVIKYEELESELPLSILANPVQEQIDTPDMTVGSAEIKLSHSELAYKDNVWGWDHEFNDLKTFFEQDK